MIKMACEYIGMVETEGIRYYTYKYRMFALAEFLDALSLGAFGTISDILEYLLPSVSILKYIPSEYPTGAAPGFHTLTEAIYLLGATVTAGGVEEAISSFLVSNVTAIYTQYPPDAEGITFLPEYDPPEEGAYWRFPVEGSEFPLYFPVGGPSGEGETSVFYRHKNLGYCHFNAYLLSLWSGALPLSSHFLANLGSFAFLVEHPFQVRYWDADATWQGKSAYLENSDWAPPPFVGHEETSTIERWFIPCWQCDPPPVLRHSPPTPPDVPYSLLPYLPHPALPGGVLTPPSGGGTSTATMSFKPFVVDGENFLVDDEQFEIKIV